MAALSGNSIDCEAMHCGTSNQEKKTGEVVVLNLSIMALVVTMSFRKRRSSTVR